MLTPPTLCPPDTPRGLDAQLGLKKGGEVFIYLFWVTLNSF